MLPGNGSRERDGSARSPYLAVVWGASVIARRSPYSLACPLRLGTVRVMPLAVPNYIIPPWRGPLDQGGSLGASSGSGGAPSLVHASYFSAARHRVYVTDKYGVARVDEDRNEPSGSQCIACVGVIC